MLKNRYSHCINNKVYNSKYISKYRNKAYLLSRLAVICIMMLMTGVLISPPCFAQQFPLGDMESLKREFMRGVQRPLAGQRADSPAAEKDDKAAGSGVTPPSSQVKFMTADELTSRSSVSFIDPNTYVLGAGDYLKLLIYGFMSEEHNLMVQPDGTVFIPPAGSISVKGMTVKEAEKRIHNILLRYFKNFKTTLQLTRLRTIEVRILGEVANPGTYIATPVLGACDILGMAGGLKKGASLRNLTLSDEKGKKIANVDLFAWYFLGDKSQNHSLDTRYVLHVPLMKSAVSIEGAFERTGEIEILPGERLSSLVSMAQLKREAVKSEGKLTRIYGESDLRVVPIDMSKALEDPGHEENDPLLVAGDNLFVPDLDIFLKKIRIIGEFKDSEAFTRTFNKLTGELEIQRLGMYNIREGETVKDVVTALGGLTAKANTAKARIERPLDNGNLEIIPINLNKIMERDNPSRDNPSVDTVLMAGDTLIVPALPDSIYITGEVRIPGAYQYNVGNKIQEYVTFAGGPTGKARLRHVRIISERGGEMNIETIDLRSILMGNIKEHLELRPGDVIYVPTADIASWKDILGIVTDLIVLRQIFGIR